MPSITGFVTEEQKEYIKEELVENGPYEDTSEVVQDLISYGLYNKHGYADDA